MPLVNSFNEKEVIKMADKKTQTTVNKSAVTGKFVSNKTVQSNPKTTYRQTVTKTSSKKGK